MESRASATGLKSVELDELTTDQIIINSDGLQYLHKYTVFLPTMTEWYYNLQEERDNIMISNTTQDLELLQSETIMGAAETSITTLGAGLFLTSGVALDLINQKIGSSFGVLYLIIMLIIIMFILIMIQIILKLMHLII